MPAAAEQNLYPISQGSWPTFQSRTVVFTDLNLLITFDHVSVSAAWRSPRSAIISFRCMISSRKSAKFGGALHPLLPETIGPSEQVAQSGRHDQIVVHTQPRRYDCRKRV